MRTLLLGRTLSWQGDPFIIDPDDAVSIETDGAVLIDHGTIIAAGPRAELARLAPDANAIDFGRRLLVPGFVDAHAHYPQTGIIASWGRRLIDWLNCHTFPEEERFSDAAHAARIAALYFDQNLANGITTCCNFCTIHPQSVEAYFREAERRGLRALGGKVCMDRNAPPGLRDTPISAYDESKKLIDRWHGRERLSYVMSPRFAPTSSPEQLDMIGQLWRERPDCLLQTHISEQHEEIAWVGELFPDHRDYLDVYDSFGLLRDGTLLGHAIHLTAREEARAREAGAAIIHCPTSNTFIGSGLLELARLKADGHRIALATDIGGGSSFSMLRTMAAAYEIGQLANSPLHPAHLLWLATAGAADALGLGHVIGNLVPGMEADITILDLQSTELIARRAARSSTVWDELFATIILGDERAIASVWSGGREVHMATPTTAAGERH